MFISPKIPLLYEFRGGGNRLKLILRGFRASCFIILNLFQNLRCVLNPLSLWERVARICRVRVSSSAISTHSLIREGVSSQAEGATHVAMPPIKAKFAFTLAEVLITLGVIGVVAAMTIPNLMAKISEKRYQTAYRKAYSVLNQALRSMMDDGYVIDLSDMSAGAAKAEGLIGDNFKILSNYFAGATRCFDNNADKCWECEKGQSGQFALNVNNGRGCKKDRPAFIDASGMAYFLYAGSEWPILVDVNGFSGPNELGKDRYVVYFTNSRTKAYYSNEVDTIYPWKDIKAKQRWCPSGDCPNTSRLFGVTNQTVQTNLDGE